MVAKSISASGTRGSALPVNGRCATPLQRQCRAAASAARYNWRRMARAPTSAPVADRWGDRLPRRLGLWSAVAVLVGSTIGGGIFRTPRSEEHTSELQSRLHLVCRLLLEKKK